MEKSTEWFQTNNFLFVLIFFSILSPAKRPLQADGSKWLKRLLLVANRDRPCTFVHFLTPPPPISLPSLSPMTSVLFKHLESLRKSSCAVHRIRNYPQNYWSFLVLVSGLADHVHCAEKVNLTKSHFLLLAGLLQIPRHPPGQWWHPKWLCPN